MLHYKFFGHDFGAFFLNADKVDTLCQVAGIKSEGGFSREKVVINNCFDLLASGIQDGYKVLSTLLDVKVKAHLVDNRVGVNAKLSFCGRLRACR